MQAFRKALAVNDLRAFPSTPAAAELWADFMAPVFVPLAVDSGQLEANGRSWLHLTNGRTHRKKPQMLGAQQRTNLDTKFNAAPDALHIISSGVAFSQANRWHKYPTDHHWLSSAVGNHSWPMLSGDVHSNCVLEPLYLPKSAGVFH